MDDEGEKIRNGIDDGGANSGKWVGGRIEEFVFFFLTFPVDMTGFGRRLRR